MSPTCKHGKSALLLNCSTLDARGFFLAGADRIERRSREGESRVLLALTLLAAGEREDLWHPGYNCSGAPPNLKMPDFCVGNLLNSRQRKSFFYAVKGEWSRTIKV